MVRLRERVSLVHEGLEQVFRVVSDGFRYAPYPSADGCAVHLPSDW